MELGAPKQVVRPLRQLKVWYGDPRALHTKIAAEGLSTYPKPTCLDRKPLGDVPGLPSAEGVSPRVLNSWGCPIAVNQGTSSYDCSPVTKKKRIFLPPPPKKKKEKKKKSNEAAWQTLPATPSTSSGRPLRNGIRGLPLQPRTSQSGGTADPNQERAALH